MGLDEQFAEARHWVAHSLQLHQVQDLDIVTSLQCLQHFTGTQQPCGRAL